MIILLHVGNIEKKFGGSFSLMTILIATEIKQIFVARTEYSNR